MEFKNLNVNLFVGDVQTPRRWSDISTTRREDQRGYGHRRTQKVPETRAASHVNFTLVKEVVCSDGDIRTVVRTHNSVHTEHELLIENRSFLSLIHGKVSVKIVSRARSKCVTET